MEIDKREEEERDWKESGSAEQPVVVTLYHVEDDNGVHLLLSMNDRAIWDLFGDQATFELHLAARYRSVELVGSGKVIVKPADQTAILAEGAQEIKRRIEELRGKHPGIRWEPWMPDRLDRRKVDKTVPPRTVPDDDPSAPNDSPEKSSNELLAAISRAIFDRIAPVVAGTVTHEGPAELATITTGFMWLRITPSQMPRVLGSRAEEVDLAATVALFPDGVRALITARVDARIRVSRSAGGPAVSISQCAEPQFRFSEPADSYNAMHALHLLCDQAQDARSAFLLAEFSAGKFVPKGWVDGEAAARCAAEAAKSATGRLPDFHGPTGKLPK
jgi:hypothetical protein